MIASLSRLPRFVACYLVALAYLFSSLLLFFLCADPLVFAFFGIHPISTFSLAFNVLLASAALYFFIKSGFSFVAGYRSIASW